MPLSPDDLRKDKCQYLDQFKDIALCVAQEYTQNIKIEINVDKKKGSVKINITEYEL